MHLHALNKHETSQANPNKGRIFPSITSVCILPNCLRCAFTLFNSMRECHAWKWKYGTQTDLKLLLCSCNFSSPMKLLRDQNHPPKVQIILPQTNASFCLVKKYHFERTSQFDKCQEYLWKLLFFFESCSLFENCNSASWVESYLVAFWTHEVRWFLDFDIVVVLQRHHQRNSIDGLSNCLTLSKKTKKKVCSKWN